jgi:malonyl-CoA O-methyltransferase
MPVRAGSVGLLCSNLALAFVADPAHAFGEFQRTLAPEGLLMFTTFGPDTLQELRLARSRLDRFSHVHAFPDMHDLGDMLVASGFSDPVMDMEHLTLTYASFHELIAELRATCGPNAARGRPRGLTGKTRHRDLARGYEALRHEGRLPATFEIVYGHAWQGRPGAHRVADTPAVIQTRFPAAKFHGVANHRAQRYAGSSQAAPAGLPGFPVALGARPMLN